MMCAHALRVDAGRADGCDQRGRHRRVYARARSRLGASSENCNKDTLGTLYPGISPSAPTSRSTLWYMGDNPANGEGFESALAYAVAGA